jgi:hypothetical protein
MMLSECPLIRIRVERDISRTSILHISTCQRTSTFFEGISANALHCATVSDGLDCRWKGGEFERVEAKNRAALKAADEAAIEDNGYFTDTDWHEVVSPDGVKCFVTSFVAPAQRALALPQPLTADLSIPEFLKRTKT